MLLRIPQILGPEETAQCREALFRADWVDGRATAGHLSERVKDNVQLPEAHPTARRLGEMILAALQRTPLFIAAALPAKVYPPLFNRYEGGQTYGTHIDGAIREIPGTGQRVRTDLSATLFLSNPEDYDGGELTVEDNGLQRIKLPAGDMILYPATSLHRVTPVTRGVRLASFFWIQSLVRDDGCRTMLLDLDTAIQHLTSAVPEHRSLVQLAGVYHNLLRLWSET
jgi:PKHD-type hydroxylase